jgi:uncharacterized membrane protein YciS (DUF1049 family)
MKAFNRISVIVSVLIIAVFAAANMLLLTDNSESGRPYLVEISRLVREIENNNIADISECEFVTNITEYGEDFYNSDSNYVIREVNDKLYRFDYTIDSNKEKSETVFVVNVILGIMSAAIIAVMLYVRFKILSPFEKLTEIPYELSKGNLTTPVKETKNRFFGCEIDFKVNFLHTGGQRYPCFCL